MKIKNRIQLENREPLAENIPLDTPWVIFVDPSDVCNFRCKFCPSSDVRLLKENNRSLLRMDFNLYKKIVNDICKFDKPIKVLRLYKDGEPLLNPRFADMVNYARESGCCERVDTTTNASLLNPKRNLDIINAGLNRINISIEGINRKQYLEFSGNSINFKWLVYNITHFYNHRKDCEMFIKINGDLLNEEDKQKFYDIFGDICDGISIEHTMNCWYGFEGSKQNEEVGIYGQPIDKIDVCPYVFYSMSINSDGTVSLCFVDWARRLIIGDVNKQSVKEIWDGEKIWEYQDTFLQKKRNELPICSRCNQLSHGQAVNLDKYAELLWIKMWRTKNDMSYLRKYVF